MNAQTSRVTGLLCLLPVCLLTACGGRQSKNSSPAVHVVHGIESAALPFVVYDRQGRTVAADALYDALAGARAVCVGERHDNPHDHWVQWRLLDELSARAATAGTELGLGLEMFQRPFQPALEAFAAGEVDERILLARSEWRHRWGYDFHLYRPLLQLAVSRRVGLVALNVRKEITKQVGHGGVRGLSASDRERLPELNLDDDQHRAWFRDAMAEHPGGVTAAVYAAQVLWDETMADTAARWIGARAQRRMLIFAGNGHCHDSAIVRRMERRGVQPVLSVRPVVDDGNGSADQALSDPDNDYVIVMLTSGK